jgi:pyruvate/2-oxoglutarate/acetoin dehydrogenase E1 component
MTLTFRDAIRDAIVAEMERDENVLFFGERGRCRGCVQGDTRFLERFGATRVFDTPISELALAGAAFGAAVAGKRPVIEIMFGDFMALPMDSLVNQSAKYWYLSNEQHAVPLVVRSAVGAGGRFGAIHSQTPATWFLGTSGLKIACPSTPAGAKGAAAGGDPRPQPGAVPRAQAPVLDEGRRPGERDRAAGARDDGSRRQRCDDRVADEGRT